MRKRIPSFLFYFLYFGAGSALFPFLALYYQQLGVTGVQLGLLTSLGPLITLVSAPLWTGLADATHRHRVIMSSAFVGTITATLFIPAIRDFLPLLLLVVLYAFMSAPIAAFADSATMSMLGDERAQYGRVRIGGTIGWGLLAPLFSALITRNGYHWSFWIFAAGMTLTLIVSQWLHFEKVHSESSVTRGLGTIMKNRSWRFFLAMAFMAGIGMATINNYLFVYLKEIGGEALMGLTLTFSVLSELPVMFFGDRLIKRFGARGLMTLSLAVVGLRLLLNAAFELPILVLLVQLVHGLTFPSVWLAGVSYAHEHAPEGLTTTAQGIFGTMVFGFGAAAGSYLGALLIDSFSARLMYGVIGSLILISLLVIQLIERISSPTPA